MRYGREERLGYTAQRNLLRWFCNKSSTLGPYRPRHAYSTFVISVTNNESVTVERKLVYSVAELAQ
jgi:hypothetical protein